jgi:G patch domain-containing protein 1
LDLTSVPSSQSDYDTFGSGAADAARAALRREAGDRPNLFEGSLLEDLVVPVADSIGMRLLQKMGWRPGKGIGTAAVSRDGQRGSKWGSVAGVSIENTPLYVLEPKVGSHASLRMPLCYGLLSCVC